MNNRYSQAVLQGLKLAGWHEGRCVDVREYTELGSVLFPSARDVLSEFGGLHVEQEGTVQKVMFTSTLP